jgi:shikimate kinase
LEREYDQAVKVSVTGQDPAVVTIVDTNDNVIEKSDF